MLELTGIKHRYGSQVALDGVALSVNDGSVGLVGVNGAGKTTLLSIASGALAPTSGAVSLAQASPYKRAERKSALERVALMPQHLHIPGHLTAHEAVSYLTWMRGMRWRDAVRSAHRALEDVGLSERSRTRVSSLSGGMVRRVALAQAIAARPALLLLDEPTTGLDPEHRRSVLDLIRGLDLTLVMSSHIIEDIATVCNRVVVLHAGQVQFDDSVAALQELAPDPAAPRALEDAFVALIARKRAA